MSEITLEVQPRETRGKNANRRLRAQGQIPAVVYGAGRDPVAIHVPQREVERLLRSSAGENTVFLLKLAGTGKSRHAMIREIQQNSITSAMTHLDFQRVLLDQEIRVMVPIEVRGLAQGVKNEGGVLDFVTREVEVLCLPTKIPPHLDVDVSPLHVGQHVEAGHLDLPEGVTLHEEPEKVIVSIAHGRVAPVVEEEEEELIEAPAAEPEVIGKKAEES